MTHINLRPNIKVFYIIFELYIQLLITKTYFINKLLNFAGVYKICFSNEFSTFTHKLVYMELNVGPEEPLPGIGEHATVLTQVFLT